MPALPWKSITPTQRGDEYVALLTYLPLASWRSIPKFIRHTRRIQRQLRHTDGVIGYALDAHPIRREFWTLSVWQNDEAISRFVHNDPHHQTMDDLAARMGTTSFTRWPIDAASVPPNWRDAQRRAQPDSTA